MAQEINLYSSHHHGNKPLYWDSWKTYEITTQLMRMGIMATT